MKGFVAQAWWFLSSVLISPLLTVSSDWIGEGTTSFVDMELCGSPRRLEGKDDATTAAMWWRAHMCCHLLCLFAGMSAK